MRKNEEGKLAWVCILIWIGIVLSVSAALLYISQTHLQEDEKKEFKLAGEFYQSYENWEMSKSMIREGRSRENEEYIWSFKNPYYKKAAPYIVMEVSGTEQQQIEGVLYGRDAEGQELEKKKITVQEGTNALKIENSAVCLINIVFEKEGNVGLEIDKMKFLEKNPISNGRELAVTAIFFFLIYIVIIVILYWAVKKREGKHKFFSDFLEMLEFIFIQTEPIGQFINGRCKEKTKRVVRGTTFMLMMLFMYGRQAMGDYGKVCYYRYDMLLCSLCIIGIGWLCWEQKLRYIRWNGVLAKSYFVFIAMMTVSDIFLKRRYSAIQYILLFSITFLMFMWQNMEKPEKLMIDLLAGAGGAVVLGSLIWVIWPDLFSSENLVKTGLNVRSDWSEQIILWKQYIYSMNLFGHGFQLKYWGERQIAYNNILEIMYRYGIIGVIPYGIMLGGFAVSIVKEILRKSTKLPKSMYWYVMLLGISGSILSLITNLEFPFASFMWPIMYLMVGWMFQRKEYETDKKYV